MAAAVIHLIFTSMMILFNCLIFCFSGNRKYALGRSVQQETFPGGENESDISMFLTKNENAIRDGLQRSINQHRLVDVMYI